KEPAPPAAAQPAPETKKGPTQPAPETKKEPTPPAPAPSPPPPAPAAVVVAAARGDGKRKRGRPRKYGPDGGLLRPLNATPISASVPDDSGGGHYTPASAVGAAMKRGRGRPVGFISRAAPVVAMPMTAATPTPAVVVSTPPPRDVVGCASGANFTPHILNVATGEDINMKVISFSQQGPRAICILSANGVISNVTLRQHDSLGGTVTYEGRFELLSLSGSFTPTEKGGSRDRCGGMSVSLAAADGRVIGGGVAGLLVAASPVQVVVGSFLPSYQMEQNGKKPVIEMKTVAAQPAMGFTISSG
uniref:AT-hook motif nuclear-localized protein n=1 Tax=Aegilops tauschii subsp. strangulata TaxID=200361 RepID=A0A453N452_AEGTS